VTILQNHHLLSVVTSELYNKCKKITVYDTNGFKIINYKFIEYIFKEECEFFEYIFLEKIYVGFNMLFNMCRVWKEEFE